MSSLKWATLTTAEYDRSLHFGSLFSRRIIVRMAICRHRGAGTTVIGIVDFHGDVLRRYSYGLYSYGLFSDGPYSHGLYSYGCIVDFHGDVLRCYDAGPVR